MEFFYSYLPWIVGILGLIVGSFLNVVVLRFGLGDGLGGRSHCPQCHKKLQWYELIPVISFLIQHAKCRGCKKNISWDYSIGELLTGIMFFFSTLYIISLFWNPFAIIFWIGLSIFLVVISFVIIIVLYDIKTRTVPLVWFLGLIISSFLFLIIYYYSFQELHITTTIPHLLGIMGAMPFLVVYLFSSGRLIGFADIEIMAWIGLFLGFVSGISAILVAFYSGAIFAILFTIFHLLQKKQYREIRKMPIAFAPFLMFGWFITLTTHFDIFGLFTRLFM